MTDKTTSILSVLLLGIPWRKTGILFFKHKLPLQAYHFLMQYINSRLIFSQIEDFSVKQIG